MAKTNFKCMFLIDDKLYKKAFTHEMCNPHPGVTESLKTIPNSIYLNPVPSSQQLISPVPANMGDISEKHEKKDFRTFGPQKWRVRAPGQLKG